MTVSISVHAGLVAHTIPLTASPAVTSSPRIAGGDALLVADMFLGAALGPLQMRALMLKVSREELEREEIDGGQKESRRRPSSPVSADCRPLS